MRLQGQPLCHGSTSSFRSAKHSALLEHEMQVGQMLKPPEIQYSFPLKDFMMHFQGPANRRGHLVDVERWHSLHKLVSLSIHLSGLGFPTGSLWDGDLLLVPQPWFSMGCSAQAGCCTLSPSTLPQERQSQLFSVHRGTFPILLPLEHRFELQGGG